MTNTEITPEIPKLHPDAQRVEHNNFIPFGPGDRLPLIEGPGHRESVIKLAGAAITEANTQHELSAAEHRNDELKESLYTDALTGIPNNEAFNLRLTESIEKADQGEVPHPAVFFIDLDNFKKANDTLGHEQVDQMLIEIASEFASAVQLRTAISSTGEELSEMIARKSGDEFVAFIYPVNDQNDRRNIDLSPSEIIKGFTERIEKLVAEIASKNEAPFVGVSVGHVVHEPGESLERVRQRADVEMYKVKNLKKGGRIKQLLSRLFNTSRR